MAALSLTLATQVQLGMKPELNAYLSVVFLATLFDYNLHRYLTIYTNPAAIKNDKLKWAAEHLSVFILLIISSFSGLVVVLFFVHIEILYLMVPLALLSFLYSFPFAGKQKHHFRLLKITGMKTFLIAFVWSSATVFIPVFCENQAFDYTQIVLLFAERFTFIFGIAIPFDIRDMETDALSLLNTIPIKFGERKALEISNLALLFSFSVATFHYVTSNMLFVLPVYLFSIVSTYIFINDKALKNMTFYYHGILDGSILFHGLLISLSFYLTL